MYPFGHMGFAAILVSLISLPILPAIIGSQIPDLIDKPLLIIGLAPNGRYIGHTILTVAVTFILTYAITRKRSVALAVTLGAFSHLLGDLPFFVPFLYPFLPYTFIPESFGIRYNLLWFSLDMAGFLAMVYIYRTNEVFRASILDTWNWVKIRVNGRKVVG